MFLSTRLAPLLYIHYVFNSIKLHDVITGLIKSVVFATIIAHVGCLEGFRVRGGPDSVGRSTTECGGEVNVPRHRRRRGLHGHLLFHGEKLMPIISVRDLVVEYDGRRAPNGVNLDIEHGETMVLLGGSGSGKSTLLRQIIGLERPKSGSVHIKGMDITQCSKSELKKTHRNIGVAFQSAALFNSLTVEENVALPLREHTRLAPSIVDLVVWMKLAAVGSRSLGNYFPTNSRVV